MRLPFAVDSLACARAAIMLIPSYTAAALTGEMVWTTPTLAGASALAASLKRPEDPTRAVDEGDTDDASSEDAGLARQLVDGPARRGLAADGRVGGAPGWTRRPPASPAQFCASESTRGAGAGGPGPTGGPPRRLAAPARATRRAVPPAIRGDGLSPRPAAPGAELQIGGGYHAAFDLGVHSRRLGGPSLRRATRGGTRAGGYLDALHNAVAGDHRARPVGARETARRRRGAVPLAPRDRCGVRPSRREDVVQVESEVSE